MSSSITWHVLKTRPRAEKKAAQQLTLLGAQVYCPIKPKVSQWSDRKKRIDHPALPSMILIKKESIDDQQIFSCSLVKGFLSHKGKRALVSEQERVLMQDYLAGKYALEGSSLSIGDQITVPVLQSQGQISRMIGDKIWVRLLNKALEVNFSVA